jgi:hypothetical protein
LCQGLGLGGDGAAVVLAVEHGPAHRRGFYGSWRPSGRTSRPAAGQPWSSWGSRACHRA